ncbi:GD15395 [Drosophila simulans]|uniref:GD15395 n=1 Tax=Drosophila simulans TaxID=7240 RepID=B4NSE4_DROSI|nr:GD15395 [Drosophila simulans]
MGRGYGAWEWGNFKEQGPLGKISAWLASFFDGRCRRRGAEESGNRGTAESGNCCGRETGGGTRTMGAPHDDDAYAAL